MAKMKIPPEVKKQADEIVHRFNRKVIKDPDGFYATRYRGAFMYLSRGDSYRVFPVCRLTYTGDMDDWDFAIYKYSSERYDPDEWMFPGMEHLDGTIEGAMRAGLEAYP